MILNVRKLCFSFVLLANVNALAQKALIAVGNQAPEIALASVAGDTITLASQKGKVVLVDFWASWCAPCVEEQPVLRTIYNQFNKSASTEKRFEIFGVSLDSKKPAWEKIIRKYRINWIQVSDLKFWRSPVAKTYEIEALPFNVLVDKTGTIIGINLHGKALEEMIGAALEK
ncbi:TlpA disulfide reductase family protein [Dyadobacter sp. CY326]|uniref:TlpA family protein disulfide reductase n=1 Tax=Dyadobacter sp. CY326 TaxID=2907300 RepID=UPI001F257DB1|nr:TlpA disulfide reductase family protein [Dyadobacter sp. CY326]MCE7066930.1 TlpA family protein disulfide reductase [Dyadobacter sp. CY326]